MIEPRLVTLEAGWVVQRIYSPTPFQTEAVTFRRFGPVARFDHHRPDPVRLRACEDQERGILYAGDGLACCLGEFFADSSEVMVAGTMAASLRAIRPIVMLDLRGTAATGVGTTQALAAISQRKVSQAWARYLYEHPQLSAVHGLMYPASNTGYDAFACFERAAGALEVLVDLELGDPMLDAELQLAADQLHWPLAH